MPPETEVPERVPVASGGTGVNQPKEPYGSKIEIERLKKKFPQPPGSLPDVSDGPAPSAEKAVPPPGQPISPSGESPVPGIPAPLVERPTDYPNRPVDAPLGPVPEAPVPLTPPQQRLRVLTALAQDEDEETAEWAQMMLDFLLQRRS